MKTNSLGWDFLKGVWKENPVLVQLLGMCPTLAVTSTVLYGLTMGLAVIFVLSFSSLIVSSFRRYIPHGVRIPCFTLIIATLVTIVDYFLRAKYPPLSRALGPYVPLIVVNCIILGRQEAFASKNPPLRAFLDALGMGCGFTLALLVLGGIRELLGSGSLLGFRVLGESFRPWVIMTLPPGAFLTLGLVVTLTRWIEEKKSRT